jgi:hypothetical protein
MSFQEKHAKSLRNRILNIAGIGIVVVLGLLPILHITIILITTGTNNISADNLLTVPLINQVLNGSYQWRNYLHDTFINGHVQAWDILIQILSAYLAHWNVFTLLYLGIVLGIIKLILLYDAFTLFFQNSKKYLLFPILSALIFSTSQISTFEFDWYTIMVNLSQLGLVFGIWGLVRFSERWRGVLLMAMGGIVASWSSGSGPLVWPTFLIGLILLNYRRVTHYVVWIITAVLTTFPYLYYTIIKSNPNPYDTPLPKINLFKFKLIVQSVGWPFAQSFSHEMAYSRGLIGWALCFIGLGILLSGRFNKKNLAPLAPGLMLIVYSIFNIWQISIFRDELTPWYASYFMVFWIGLLGLAFTMWMNRERKPTKITSLSKVVFFFTPFWSVIFIVSLLLFYLTSNLSYADKSYFLQFRSPASNSCLRNYKTAPTYCEWYLYSWQLDHIEELFQMAESLERHHLSVFAPHQQWTLQGDFILDNVRLHKTPGISDIFWTADSSNIPTPFYDYRHLNLFLHSPNYIDWTMTLPQNLKQAVFHSAIAISKLAPNEPQADGVIFEVSVEPQGKPREILYGKQVLADQRDWQPFSIPLTEYAGRTITLRLSSNPGNNITHDWAMYRYPFIDVELNPTEAMDKDQKIEIRPSNTDLSPMIAVPTPNDLQFDVDNPQLWKTARMKLTTEQTSSGDSWIVRKDPIMEYNQAMNVCLADYTHFYVKMAASQDINNRAVQFYYKLNNQNDFDEAHSIMVPILADDKMHEYTYDIKLMEQNSQSRLTGIRLDPVMDGKPSGKSWVNIADFRLIRGSEPSACH